MEPNMPEQFYAVVEAFPFLVGTVTLWGVISFVRYRLKMPTVMELVTAPLTFTSCPGHEEYFSLEGKRVRSLFWKTFILHDLVLLSELGVEPEVVFWKEEGILDVMNDERVLEECQKYWDLVEKKTLLNHGLCPQNILRKAPYTHRVEKYKCPVVLRALARHRSGFLFKR